MVNEDVRQSICALEFLTWSIAKLDLMDDYEYLLSQVKRLKGQRYTCEQEDYFIQQVIQAYEDLIIHYRDGEN